MKERQLEGWQRQFIFWRNFRCCWSHIQAAGTVEGNLDWHSSAITCGIAIGRRFLGWSKCQEFLTFVRHILRRDFYSNPTFDDEEDRLFKTSHGDPSHGAPKSRVLANRKRHNEVGNNVP
jgi:hypothetical protein